MRQLWLFFEKYNIVFLFLFLELIGFSLFFSRNNYQKSKFLHSTSFFQSKLAENRNNVAGYFDLKKQNELLAAQNESLLEELSTYQQKKVLVDSTGFDSLFFSNYEIQPAEVITSSTHGGNNLLTVTKGSKDGVVVGDGVLGNAGAIGKVVETRDNYSLVMPLFNRNMRLNVQHKKSEYNGDLIWSGSSLSTIQVESIPRTANVEIGDTIVTNQYSKSIPAETMVGEVAAIKYDIEGNFYLLDVTPFSDFRKLNYVYLVHRKDIEEIIELETGEN